MTDNVRVKIAKDGAAVEVEGTKKFVEDTLERFLPLLGLAQEKQKDSKPKTTAKLEGKAISPSEYIRLLGFKKHTDIVLAFGFYLEKFTDAKDFVPADINRLYYESKLEASNSSQMIIQNIKRGYMMEAKKSAKKDKRFTLTQSGMDHLEKQLELKQKADK